MRGARFVLGAIGLMLAVGCRAEPDLPLTALEAFGVRGVGGTGRVPSSQLLAPSA